MNREPFRQGDVLVSRIDAIPKGAKPVARDGGRIVLAYGEATGHAHAIPGPGAALLEIDGSSDRFLQIMESSGVTLTPKKIEKSDDARFVRIMDASGTIVRFLSDDDYARAALDALRARGSVDLAGEMVKHDEHDATVLKPGNYRVRQQREYVAGDVPQRVMD